MYLSIEFYEHGVRCDEHHDVLYDIESNTASMGAGESNGPSLLWRLGDRPAERCLLAHRVALGAETDWLVRCDRVDFPPGGVAYRHTHPGPGIRCTLFGGLTIEANGQRERFGRHEAWFEAGPEPVLAVADPDTPSAFVRVMLLPASWKGKRTIRYVDPADAERPKLQRPTVFFDRDIGPAPSR